MKKQVIALALAATMLFAGCDPNKNKDQATKAESSASRTQLSDYLAAQPIPAFKTSQLRQNLIEIETAQANTTATTSFMFNQGVQDPITVCPSIGFPIPASYQLTNPQAKQQSNGAVLPQLETTGIYTGDSTGTYVICINDAGQAYAQYWEGFVSTVTGAATWDNVKHMVEFTSAPTAAFSTGK